MAPPLEMEEMRALVTRSWILHQQELLTFNRIYDYVKGNVGYPSLPASADNDVRAIARLSIKNVLAPVRDSFAQNLCVVGYRTATSEENLPAWKQWQANRMDARQSEIHRPALTYGVSYCCVTPGKNKGDPPLFRPRSPRQLIGIYADPQIDQWPQYALETWVDSTDGRRVRRGVFFDDTYIYPLNLGPVLPYAYSDSDERLQSLFPVSILDEDSPPIPHGAEYCPVVRYINDRDADDMIVGEIEPLITLQRAITETNFDRLVVARFGAFPQKVISGWSGSKDQVLEASAHRVWAFDDPEVKAYTLQPASLSDYNELLQEQMEHVAMMAAISPAAITGKLINVSADALAAAEAQQQRKLASKRDSFGESHEQLLQCAAQIAGDNATASDEQAEVQWRDTEARSFAAVVDGVTKLVLSGVPLQYLLPMIPGMTQQQIVGIEKAVQAAKVAGMIDALRTGAGGAATPPSGPASPAQLPGVPGAQPYGMPGANGAAPAA